jgi:hypothetical protein
VNEIATIKPSSMMTSIIPHNLEDVYRLAKAVSLSGLSPKDMKSPEQITVAILHGLEIGLKPMQAIQRIAVINGRPTIWGDAAIGLVRASGLLEEFNERMEGEGDARVAICTLKRRNEAPAEPSKFSVEDAKVAKLWQKKGYNGQDTPWITHPDRMLKMRARGFALRDSFSDVLGGMYLAEELQGETIDAAPAIPTPPTPPKLMGTAPADNSVATEGKGDAAHIAEGPNRAERGEFVDKNGVEIPIGALNDFDAFRRALDSCPTLDSLNAMYEALTKNMAAPDDLDEAQNILREVASRFPFEEEQ